MDYKIHLTYRIMELSKKDKRLCREFIHRSLELECEQFIKKLQKAAAKPMFHK